jgi:hypothetical protein
MPIRMNKPGESSFGINVDDSFDPTDDHTVELVDMDEFQGVSKIDGKPYTSIVWKFAIYGADGIAFTNLIDGGVFETWQFSSLSLSEKSQGRAWAAALLGKPSLTDAECDAIAEAFDSALVGKQATASWKVEDVNGNKRLKLALLRPLKKTGRRAAADVAAEAPPEFVTPNPPPRSMPTTNGPSPARQTAAERRAQLEAELAGLSDENANGDVPF